MNKKNKAFTLVEVMVSLSIFAIVIVVGYALINRTFVSMERQKQSLDTLHEARRFLMYIERDLREMIELKELDTIYANDLYNDENALLFKMVLTVPSKDGKGIEEVTYSYQGPEHYQDDKKSMKIISREVLGGTKLNLITKQLKHLKIWGTDGVIFRNRYKDESLADYRNYIKPHYYHPTNSAPNGLRKLSDIKGIEVNLCMHEIYNDKNEPIKDRTFVTRIYSRVLNAKYD